MTIEGAKVSLTCGSARFSLQTMPVDEYPALPDMPQATGTVRSDLFANAVAQAVTAAGRDDMLPVLTGVRIEIDDTEIALLATDRFRLSLRELSWDPGSTDVTAAALVPARVLADTAKSLTAGTEVTIALSTSGAGEGIIGFEGSAGGGVRRTTTRLLDGEFPKVRTLFPSEQTTIARVDRATLVEAVKRVSLVAERNTAVQLAFTEGLLTLDAGSGDEALATEQIEASVKGEDITTGFNPQFLLDGLTAIESPVVEMAFTQASKPAVMAGVDSLDGEADLAFRYLLMPRRLLS
jgi:DNA polymerase-3 subunit beta